MAEDPSSAAPAELATALSVSSDWERWLDDQRRLVDEAIATETKALKARPASHSRLIEAIDYSLRHGGKRVRPVLVLEAARVCGGQPTAALPAALALEFVHTFSLIHDDLPAMDDDDLRRGQPTNHKVFGEALAILAGDWLLTRAFGLLAQVQTALPHAAELVATLAVGTAGMIEGQAADIAGESRPTDATLVEYIHHNKTAALIEAAGRLGALCAGANERIVAAFAAYGRHLGLAFQIADDLLDCTGSAAATGKRVGKDAQRSKQTYPAAFGLTASRRKAEEEVALAVAALADFGSGAERLRDMARYVIARDR